jgi:pimeloyl-ACP methyl ester carboxylesterase
MSFLPRPGCPYQVHVGDLLASMTQFGLSQSVIVAEGLGCVTALILAAWHPERVGALALVDACYDGPPDAGLITRSLRECPPDWSVIRAGIGSPILELSSASPALAAEVERLLGTRLP